MQLGHLYKYCERYTQMSASQSGHAYHQYSKLYVTRGSRYHATCMA